MCQTFPYGYSLKWFVKVTFNNANVPVCNVDGKSYHEGEFFKPSKEPNKKCYCGAGYNGILSWLININKW